MPAPASRSIPKYSQVYSALRRDIESGRWREETKLPSEVDLVRQFGVSRITVTRAVRELQAAGLVQRVAGSGTFVKRSRTTLGQSFGLLIPDLGETEIFEPICQGMMASPLARAHALVWGSAATEAASNEARALSLCRQYIERGVSGVFFAPVELTPSKDEVNRGILRALDEARIPVVLLDRPVVPYPQNSQHDLVGIDNRRAGYVITEHLLNLGCRRIVFVGLPHAAATVNARAAAAGSTLDAAPADASDRRTRTRAHARADRAAHPATARGAARLRADRARVVWSHDGSAQLRRVPGSEARRC